MEMWAKISWMSCELKERFVSYYSKWSNYSSTTPSLEFF